MWLEHEPSGLRVEAQVPVVPGVPDNPPLLEAQVRKSLFAQLELKVARNLGLDVQPE